MEHTLELTNGAALLLRSILSHPESTTGLKDKFAASVLVSTTLETLPEVPSEGADAWVKEPWQTVTLSESQRDACKKAVTWACDKGVAPSGAALGRLISLLGLDA